MKLQPQIYTPAAVITFLILAGVTSWLWSNHKVAELERDVENAKAAAFTKENIADEKERQAAEYKAKTEYLEKQIADIRAIAKQQDEELQKLSADTNNARANVRRTRGISSAATTAKDLCAKLAELGHPCN